MCDLIDSKLLRNSDDKRIEVPVEMLDAFGGQNIDFGNLEGIDIPAKLINRMFDHQLDGVKWMWGLFQSKNGGILGDGESLV